jgi:octopine/nopaline transport system permease protein
MLDFQLMAEAFPAILGGTGNTLMLVSGSLGVGIFLAVPTAFAALSNWRVLRGAAGFYVMCFRGTPLLVQIFLIYYGLGQFAAVRESILWPILREPWWCALLALSLNTGAYTGEIVRGGLMSVPAGQIEAARAAGMSGLLLYRRIIGPIALRQALPAYSNEVVSMIKSTALASTVTIMEVTGIARRFISETFKPIEIFLVAGAIYLVLTFLAARVLRIVEWRLSPHLRNAKPGQNLGNNANLSTSV